MAPRLGSAARPFDLVEDLERVALERDEALEMARDLARRLRVARSEAEAATRARGLAVAVLSRMAHGTAVDENARQEAEACLRLIGEWREPPPVVGLAAVPDGAK